ncbi:xanthine dehydrogenase family protein subunit M [Brevibacterium daeguense]|uniref:Xanthine dehydrogenase family protein subunit M n=1 Tax=Brevibacterium daeguense TaxID=909936 RepID=A0ABP8EK49_9MICO
MNPFDYARATDIDGAVTAVAARPGAAFLAGGTNLVDHLKLGVASPEALIDIRRLPLDEVTELPDGGVRVGATVTNSELAAHPLIRERFPALSQALLSGASGQLRNLATTGGNLLQRTRCVYFQDVTTPCSKREPGSGCSALDGYTRYHAILGASEHCVAVHPSDMAVAMLAYDAVVVTTGRNGERRIPLAEFHRLPGDEPSRDTVLEHGELITAVELPARWSADIGAGQERLRSTYRKVRDRASYAFALVSVAAVVELAAEDSGAADAAPRIADCRIVLGGVAHRPWRAERAEDVLRGAPAAEDAFRRAAEAELAAARPLRDNAFKIPMARSTLVAVLRELTAGPHDQEPAR